MIPNVPISPSPDRCKLFDKLATAVWNYIIRCHEVNVHAPEVGITNFLITEIRHHTKAMPNFDVYARNFIDEPTYGGDIDVFVEIEHNRFLWFAMQAKVLYQSRDYGKWVKKGANQWDKLKKLETIVPVRPYFLLYNGLADYQYSGYLCGQALDEKQFGCSMVDVHHVASFMSRKTPGYKPKFNDFHPESALPWRILTCCMQPYTKEELFTRDEVSQAFKSYTNLAESHAKLIESQDELSRSLGDGKIGNANSEVGREPDFAIVINRTN
jgi:hypothetical protein